MVLVKLQRFPPVRGGTGQRKIIHLANWSQLIHPGPTSSRSSFFMESSESCASMLTHYSNGPLTTGPDFQTLLWLLALAGDVHPNSGPPRYPCSVCFKNVTNQVPASCVQNARIGYIQDGLVFKLLRIIVEPMAGSVPHVGRHHSHAHRLVALTFPPCQTRRSTYLSGTPMASAINRRNKAFSLRHTTSKWLPFRSPS